LIRELILHAVRWPITRREHDPVADDYFRTIGHLIGDALQNEAWLSIPTSSDPVVAAAIEYTQNNLTTVSIIDLAAAVGVSARTLRRRFANSLGMTWRTYLTHARLLRSMALLAEPDRTVLDVALAVGFENVSAFTRAFTRHTGELPSAYRRRVATT
jgi:transcriptional regulator GlxA family with amidase domain